MSPPVGTNYPAAPVDHDLEVSKLEAVEMYAATVTAWYTTAMEFDRAVVTLSAAALGLLIGLATTSGQALSRGEAYAYSFALVFFCIALACLLMVFKFNKDYLEEMVVERGAARSSHMFLRCLDWAGLISFVLGAILAISLGVVAVHKKVDQKKDETQMSDNSKTTPSVPAFDSVNGAMKLSTKSFNGATALARPASAPASSAAATTQAATPAPAPAAAQTPSTPAKSAK